MESGLGLRKCGLAMMGESRLGGRLGLRRGLIVASHLGNIVGSPIHFFRFFGSGFGRQAVATCKSDCGLYGLREVGNLGEPRYE